MYAATSGNSNLVYLLLERGANVNAKNEHGGSSLHLAVRKNFLETVEALIEFGADII